MNLITWPWLPIRRQDGTREWLEPYAITGQYTSNPVVSIDATRTPWNAALTEFLIALFQTAMLPEDAKEWRNNWQNAPTPGELKSALLPFSPYFELEGKNPFMQDKSLRLDKRDEDYRKPIQKFLVDGVSEQQEKNNADLFEKSGAVSALCGPCAASALWDMQAHAPQGSAGYYTSLRGGGPSSTIILGHTLWETIWANVLEQSCFDMKGRPDPKTFFPWMKPGNRKVTSADENPLHVYWGMPRRVLLEQSTEASLCDTCGSEEGIYKNFLSYRGGLHYSESDWRHPLSPYILSKDQAWLVRATEPDMVGYKHYMGILIDTPAGDGVPAFVVRRAIERELDLRVWGYGYQCDQASVISWCEGSMPVETGKVQGLQVFARTLVALCQRGVERLCDALHGVWDESNAGGEAQALAVAKNLWSGTEHYFKSMMIRAAEAKHEALLDEWVTYIQRSALSLYRKALPRTRIDPMWAARFEHRLAGQLSSRNPMTLKTRKYGDWRIEEAV